MDAQPNPVDSDVTAVFVANLPSLEGYTRKLTRDPEAAADVCQEVFLKLLLAARAGRMPDVPGAWMHRVAHNIVISSVRRRSTRDRTLERLSESNVVRSTEDTVLDRERDARVRHALTTVRPFEREAMMLAAEGYRADEIGDRIGRTALATRTMLCRARSQVRTELAGFDAA